MTQQFLPPGGPASAPALQEGVGVLAPGSLDSTTERETGPSNHLFSSDPAIRWDENAHSLGTM